MFVALTFDHCFYNIGPQVLPSSTPTQSPTGSVSKKSMNSKLFPKAIEVVYSHYLACIGTDLPLIFITSYVPFLTELSQGHY